MDGLPAMDGSRVTGESRAVGYVVGEVRTDAFTFVTNPAISPPRLEYVVLRGVREPVGEEVREVDVLAQVASLAVNSRLLAPTMNYSEVEAILRRLGASPPVVVGQAKVLGYLDGKVVRLPRGAAMPGAVVHRAPDELLRRFFSRDVTSGIHIGALINRPRVDVLLNPNGLQRHMAVIAQTGAGKSYAVGVILEKLLQLGGTIVVFDPNSDYVLMRHTPERTATPFAERVQVYRLPGEQPARISDEEIGETRRLTVRFSNLEVEEICELAGVAETYTNIRKAVQTAYDRLQGRDYTPEQLLAELERIAGLGGYGQDGGPVPTTDPFGGLLGGTGSPAPGSGDRPAGAAGGSGTGDDADRRAGGALGASPHGIRDDLAGSSDADPAGDPSDVDDVLGYFGPPEERASRRRAAADAGGAADDPPLAGAKISPDAIAGALKAQKYIEFLSRLRIWGFDDIPIEDLLRPMSLATVDLAGAERRIADFVVTRVVSEIWKRAVREGLTRPVFIILEEAHNFVPAGRDEGQAGYWLKRIASEGRKFGIFLVLVTQRPYRVHQDTLSQCGSQIIMRLTNPEDQNAVRRASESISEGLLNDLPGLNVGEAVVLGPLVRVPVMVRIGRRESDEGGSDIDVVERLESAQSEVVTERHLSARRAERAERGRSEWQEEV